ncbi:MAG TPA: ABC transporter permease subunit [Thermomicrobiales bacterium]|nr:ABC transporter permease subunit [Thermomicrobiales bacterium]
MASDTPRPYGEVYDLGYQHYSGPRLGRSHAIRALTIYSIKRGLGIKKKWTSKIMPALLYTGAFMPAVIVSGILAFAPTGVSFGYHNLFQIVSLVLFVFAAALAPEMLSDDRRENVLALYFARSITRVDYLLSKLFAMAILMGTMIYGPAALLFAANVLLAGDPIAYFFDHLGDLGRIAVSGALAAAFLAAIGLAVAAHTNRKGVATGLIIGGAFVLAGIAAALFNALDSNARDYVIFLSPMDLMEATSAWIFGNSPPGMAALAGVYHAAAMLVVIGLAAGIMYRRYLAED